MKKPWLAALLNVIPLGFGYAYLGRWRRFLLIFLGFPIGFALYISLLVILIFLMGFGMGGYPEPLETLLPLILLFAAPMLVAAFTARDAWRIARSRGMNDAQERIGRLIAKGWTKAALADELGMGWMGLQQWTTGAKYPAYPKVAHAAIDALLKRKRIPKNRRYAKGRSPRTGEG